MDEKRAEGRCQPPPSSPPPLSPLHSPPQSVRPSTTFVLLVGAGRGGHCHSPAADRRPPPLFGYAYPGAGQRADPIPRLGARARRSLHISTRPHSSQLFMGRRRGLAARHSSGAGVVPSPAPPSPRRVYKKGDCRSRQCCHLAFIAHAFLLLLLRCRCVHSRPPPTRCRRITTICVVRSPRAARRCRSPDDRSARVVHK